MLASDIIKDHELPLKKQKILGDYINPLPYNLYASLDAMYLNQCLQEFQAVNRHLSAFKPVNHHKEPKLYNHLIGMGMNRYNDAPVLQNPERVVMMSESERFERSFQPNVALAPTIPKKHRYGKLGHLIKDEVVEVKKEIENSTEVIVKQEIEEQLPESSTPVSVVQSTSSIVRYNSEIELSTDTEDSASEVSDKPPLPTTDLGKVEELLKEVNGDIKERILNAFKYLMQENDRWINECRTKDEKICELEAQIGILERRDLPVQNGLSHKSREDEDEVEEKNRKVLCNGDINKVNISSSIIKTKENCESERQKTSVIASLEDVVAEPKAIINTAPE